MASFLYVLSANMVFYDNNSKESNKIRGGVMKFTLHGYSLLIISAHISQNKWNVFVIIMKGCFPA